MRDVGLQRPFPVLVLVAFLILVGGIDAWASGRFVDTADNVHEGNIEAIAAERITRGCNPPVNDRYCPRDPVTRGQMAAFLRRAFQLPAADQDFFIDDDDSTFEGDINALAEAGITRGCNPPRNNQFCPDDFVTRGQMAAFLRRAFGLPSSSTDFFVDDDDSIFEGDINAIAEAGITRGCNPPANDHYCPHEFVLRDQMASFLARALGLPPGGPLPGQSWILLGEGAPSFSHADISVDSIQIEGVATNSSVLAAVGTVSGDLVGGPENVSIAAAWFSNDGTTWTRARFFEPATETLIDHELGHIHSVTEWKGGFLAVGCRRFVATHSVVWFSADGQVWEPVWAEDPHGFPDSCMNDILNYDEPDLQALVAVGWQTTAFGSTQRRAMAWSGSSDARFWSERPLSQPGGVGTNDDVEAKAVGTRPQFLGLVAVGNALGSTGPRGVHWNSVDGSGWSFPAEVPNAGLLREVTGTSTELVVAGSTRGSNPDGGIWTSPAGSTWTLIGLSDQFGGSGTQVVEAVTFHSGNWVAVGYDSSRPAAWSSPDGTIWTKATGVGPAQGKIFDVVSHQGRLYAVGKTGNEPAVWVSPP